VRHVYASHGAFAALKDDGSVVAWGHDNYGGDTSKVADALRSGVKELKSSGDTFTALKDNGSSVQWP